MKFRISGVIVPISLLLLLFGTASITLASSGHGEEAKAPAAHAEATVEKHAAPAADAHKAAADTHKPAADAHAPASDAHGAAADAHGEAGGHGDTHASNSLSPEKLKDLFWRTVNFIALVIILVKFLAKPIASGLSGRQKQIQEELSDLETKRDDAQAEYSAFEARLAGMEQEMEQVVEKAIAQAENEKQRILSEAEAAAEDIKRQAEASIQAELEDAKRALREEVAEQAAVMAEELIVQNLKPEDQVAITEQFLERVGAVQ